MTGEAFPSSSFFPVAGFFFLFFFLPLDEGAVAQVSAQSWNDSLE